MSLIPRSSHATNGRFIPPGGQRKKWLIVQPKSNTNLLVDSGKVSMPLNLLMVGTLVQKYFDLDFVDERIGDEVPDDLSDYDVVALTVRTLNAKKSYQIADKALAQGKRVIMGGVHPTMLPEEAREHCTSIVATEIESIWEVLFHDFYQDRLKPVYRATGFKDMAEMEHANFNLALKSKNAKRYSFRIPLLATKGCPISCSFCCAHKVYGKVYRTRTPDHVIEEIRYHQQRLGRKDINVSFMDDNISFRPAFLEELLNKMVGLGVKWNSNISMNFLEKPHIPELAKNSGCELLNVGFESLNPETIKSVGKGSNRISHYDLVVQNTKKQNLALQGYFIFGFDTDTPEGFQITYDFIMRNRIEFPVFTIATPFPGTEWFEEMKDRVLHLDWDKYDTFHYMYHPTKMEQSEFLRNFIKIQQEVYSWKGIYHRLRGRKIDWIWGANLAMHYFVHQLKPEMLL
jgi:radical SAM superfamily enzyme YgiQ (UPF0313 family)